MLFFLMAVYELLVVVLLLLLRMMIRLFMMVNLLLLLRISGCSSFNCRRVDQDLHAGAHAAPLPDGDTLVANSGPLVQQVSLDDPPPSSVDSLGVRWTRCQWEDWERWEDVHRPESQADHVDLMQRSSTRDGSDAERAEDSPPARESEAVPPGDRDPEAGGAPPQEDPVPSLSLSPGEQQSLLDAGWPLSSVTHITDFCDFLEWARGEFGAGAVAWALDAWGDALVVGNATVELAQETLWDRLQQAPVQRPPDAGVRGRLVVGFAGFQRQVGDLHVALVQEGLRRQWLPRNEDSDGRQLPEPPFVRGDNAAWAMTRARTLARDYKPESQTHRPAEPRPVQEDRAEDEMRGSEDRDERDFEFGYGDEEEDDTGSLMQLSLEEEARLHQYGVQNEARRHLRSLLLALNNMQDRGEGPEYRWGVRLVVDAWDASVNAVNVLRDVLFRRTTDLGAMPYFPALREPPCGVLRSRVVAYTIEFRHLLERALAEEMAMQLIERARTIGESAGVPPGRGVVATSRGRNTRPRRGDRDDRGVPRGSRSRSPPGTEDGAPTWRPRHVILLIFFHLDNLTVNLLWTSSGVNSMMKPLGWMTQPFAYVVLWLRPCSPLGPHLPPLVRAFWQPKGWTKWMLGTLRLYPRMLCLVEMVCLTLPFVLFGILLLYHCLLNFVEKVNLALYFVKNLALYFVKILLDLTLLHYLYMRVVTSVKGRWLVPCQG
eukprot:s2581_g4.t2